MSGTESVGANEDSRFWTLEEIGRLVSRQRRSVGNADQHRASHSTALSDRRLLGLPARAGSLQSGARRHHRLAQRQRRPRPHAADRGSRRAGRRTARAAGRRRRDHPSALQVLSARPAKIRITRFSACRSSTAGCCRACSSSRRSKPRTFAADDVRMLVMAGAQLAPIVSEARTLGQFVAPAHQRLLALAQNLWWSWDNDTTQPVSRARPGAVARARQQSDRAPAADCRSKRSRSAPRSSRCTAASTTPTGACRSI